MKLLILSGTPHYRDAGGQYRGWGPTLKEIDHLSTLFDRILHLAPCLQGEVPKIALPYESQKVNYQPLPFAGGDHLWDKLKVIFFAPYYFYRIIQACRQADVVHVRCPSNIGLISLLALIFLPRPKYRWVKYAGNWQPNQNEPWTYTLQRFILEKNWHRGLVTVNGTWPNQPQHVITFNNPCLIKEDLVNGRNLGNTKKLTPPIHFVFVGSLESIKGVRTALEIMRQLKDKKISFHMDFIGDGHESVQFKKISEQWGLETQVKFHGWLPQHEIRSFYETAHFILLPAQGSEGFPKVLSEAMAYGAVPLAGAVSSIPQTLAQIHCGCALDPIKPDLFVKEIERYLQNPAQWKMESEQGFLAAAQATYEFYLESVLKMFLEKNALALMPNKFPRLCFVGPMTGKNPGYVSNPAELLSEHFKKEGYSVSLTSSHANRFVRMIDIFFTLSTQRNYDIQCLQVYGGRSFVIEDMASQIAKKQGKKIIMVLHGGAMPEFMAQFPKWTKRVLQRADLIVAPSAFLARAVDRYGFQAMMIPNLIDLSEYPYRRRTELKPNLLWMRSFFEAYNPEMAIRVMSQFKKLVPDARLIMAGQDKGLEASIRQQTARLGLDRSICFPGYIQGKDKVRFGEQSDIFINTNHIDNMPIALLEAAAFGIPIVTTDVGGIRDFFTDRETALFVPDNDADAMVRAISELLKDKVLATRLSENGRKLAETCGWLQVSALWEKAFEAGHRRNCNYMLINKL